jgi:cysteine desulfurase
MIYLDYNSTTPVHETVLEAMLPYFSDKFGNAASITHKYGWLAKGGVESATEQIAALLNCHEQELVYTSGATESVNLAIKGVYEIYKRKGNHIITVKTEHKAVLDTCAALEKKGARITLLDVDPLGRIDLDQLKTAISDQTLLVAVMHVNNETGVIQPMEQIAEIVHAHNCILLSDATQAVGKLPIDLDTDRIDLLAFSAHKFYGPKGIGGLFVRRKKPRVILEAMIHGGGHQRGLRSGTLNVPGIIGMGAAAALAQQHMSDDAGKIGRLRDALEKRISALKNAYVNASKSERIYNTSNICLKGVGAADIISALKTQVAVSTGSACTAEDQRPSHVLMAMGLSEEEAYSSIRFSLGRTTTETEINVAAGLVIERVNEVLEGRPD